ncbi:MAG: ABC transporter permease [Lachnospiraceae bacterium]|jgi:teichoic acid transport system permease protein|nr:ABC transporter permease [Lachnospiraceae bacterium]
MKKRKLSKKANIILVSIVALALLTVILLHRNPFAIPHEETVKKCVAGAIIVISVILYGVLYDKIIVLPSELYQNRRLIWKLAKNDFKTRFAGSYLGIVWAFVQPVVTILVYWIVFEKGLNAKAEMLADGTEAPYVLWLTAGLVPWFYFSEALSNGTTALLEYNYLVKKVVFKISILPIIKIIAATFIHGFFVLFMLLLYMAHGFFPDAYTLQLLYYSFCLFIFVLGISYATCAVVIFFRDLTHMIAIVLQVGMWATPILWALDRVPQQYQILFKLNPMFYIVNGYRSAMLEKTWFWEDFYSTMFFWIITAVIFGIGALIFKRLKIHFADML